MSLSENGQRLAVGAPSSSPVGYVRMFEYNGLEWIQLGADIEGEGTFDQFGASVSLSANGNRVAVGAPRNSDNGSLSGHVRIYEYNGVNWVQLGADINGESASNLFGSSLSLSADGNRVAVGAPRNSDNGSTSGHVRLFEFNGNGWTQLGLDIDGESPNDRLGTFVKLSENGSVVAIGAGSDGVDLSGEGEVVLYEFNGIDWIIQSAIINEGPPRISQGASYSFSADSSRVVFGYPFSNNPESGLFAGYVQVFSYQTAASSIEVLDTLEVAFTATRELRYRIRNSGKPWWRITIRRDVLRPGSN